MTLAVRCTSSAAVTTRRTCRTCAHFAARPWSSHAAGVSGISCKCTDPSSPGNRDSQTSSMVNTNIGASHVVSR